MSMHQAHNIYKIAVKVNNNILFTFTARHDNDNLNKLNKKEQK